MKKYTAKTIVTATPDELRLAVLELQDKVVNIQNQRDKDIAALHQKYSTCVNLQVSKKQMEKVRSILYKMTLALDNCANELKDQGVSADCDCGNYY